MYNRQLAGGLDALESDEFEYEDEYEDEYELAGNSPGASPFAEAEEMELAAQLLEITDEAELDQFLGNLVKKAWKGIRKVGGKILRPLGGALKAVAKKALPFVGGALGSFIPIPGVGTAVGTALGGALSKAFELEYEGLSPEDQEFEMARSFVRLAGSAAQQAARAQPGVDPQIVVRNALVTAARQQVPALAKEEAGRSQMKTERRRSGRWTRRGQTIVVQGV
jgi:uncharacterized protein (DUF697 family)